MTVTVAATPTRPVRRQLSDRDRQSSPTGNIRSSSVSINPRHKKNSFKGRKRMCLFVCLWVCLCVRAIQFLSCPMYIAHNNLTFAVKL